MENIISMLSELNGMQLRCAEEILRNLAAACASGREQA